MAKSRSLSHGLVRRAEISLLAAEGWPNEAVAAAVGVTRATVGKWRRRFLENGLPGLHDELRSGAPRSSTDEQVAEVVYKTLKTKPKDGNTVVGALHGRRTGLTKDAVHRIWRTYGLQPHRHKHFTLSTDPFFVDKVRDIVGLYLNPPEHALVLCVDEKSRIQALERSQPMLPLGLGYVEGITHDYKRHGTTTLFAALDVATGEVMTQCKPRHRHQEFLQFLRHIEAHVPADLDIHLVVDNYATHKHAKVKRWLAPASPISRSLHPHLCFVAQSGGDLVQYPYPPGGSARFVPQGVGAHRAHRTLHGKWKTNAHPFVWTATADSILAKIKRLCERISATQH